MSVRCISLLPCGLLLSAAVSVHGEAGVILETWFNVKGGRVSDLTESTAFKKSPPQARLLPEFAFDTYGNDYGSRLSTIITAPETGEYTFWIASDDSSELWLAPDENPDHARKIASVSGYVAPKRWNAKTSQKSEAIQLKKGQRCYLMALYKEHGGADHLAVAWQGPSFTRRIVGDAATEAPTLSPGTRRAVERAKMVEALLVQLQDCKPGEVASFVSSLGKADHKGLAQEMGRIAERLRKVDLSNADRTMLQSFARAAAGLNPSAEQPVDDPVLCALLFMESAWLKTLPLEELEKAGPHRAAAAFGDIPSKAKAVACTIRLTSESGKKGVELLSTGLYALPGRTIQVHVPENLVDESLSVVIGHHRVPSMEDRKLRLVSMPDARWQTELDDTATRAINPHGGLIFIRVPADSQLDGAEIVIEGAIESPRFILGRDNDETWKKLRSAPGPWGELVCDHLIMVVDSETLRMIDDPTALMTWWNGAVHDHEAFYNHDRGMPFRMHTTYYARQGVSYWPLEWAKANVWNVVCTRKLKAYSDGLFLHEHGHHADDGRMMFGKIGESTPNWAGYYMKATNGDFAWKDTEETHLLALFDPEDGRHREIMADGWWETKYTHYWSYPMTSVVVGYANTFGWDAFKRCVHRFTHEDDQINTDPRFHGKTGAAKEQSVIDKWLIFLSGEAKHDIRPYFAHFQLKPSPEADAHLDKMELPEWDAVYVPRRPVIISTDQAVKMPSPETTALTFSGKVECVAMGEAQEGSLERSADGMLLYRPRKGFAGRESIPYTLANGYGNEIKGTLEIIVLPDEQNPHLAAGEAKAVEEGKWTAIRFTRAYRNPVFTASISGTKYSRRMKKMADVVIRTRNLTADGCEVAVFPVKDGSGAALHDLSWLVMESGTYSEQEHGILAHAFRDEADPAAWSEEPDGLMSPSYDGNIPMLRAARFGQVLTCNNEQWSSFFSTDVRTECAVRYGCYHGTGSEPKDRETIGMIFLGRGLYHFGGQFLKVGADQVVIL